MKSIVRKEMFINRGAVLVAGMVLTMIAGVAIWCASTTFRAMSDWMLYAVNIATALLLSLPALLFRRVWIQSVIMVLIDLLWIANIMYCRTYFTGIPADAYLMASNLGDFTASVADSIRWADILLPVITAAATILAFRIPPSRPWPRRDLCIDATAILWGIVGIGLLCRGGFYKSYDKLAQSCYYSTCGLPTYTVAGHLLYNAMNEPPPNPGQAEAEVREWLAEKETTRPFRPLPDSIPTRKNLVVILLESFESWPIQKSVDGVEITPYINSLLKLPDTFFAPEMLTQVGPGRSIDAQLLIGSGMLPLRNAVYSMKYPQYQYPSIMKALREDRAARSIILTCDKPITWNQEVIARSAGYDSLLSRSSWKLDEMIGNPAKLSDGSFLRQAVGKLKADELRIAGKPFMLTFVTYSGHNPFILPDNLKDPALRKATERLPAPLGDYVQMARYTDSQLHTLIDWIRSRPDFSETLVLITGDHEGLASYRDALRSSPEGAALVDAGQFTPFILLNSPIGGRDDRPMGQVDIYPTLLALLGLDNYGWKGVGENILAPRIAPMAISSTSGQEVGIADSIPQGALTNLRNARRIGERAITTGVPLF